MRKNMKWLVAGSTVLGAAGMMTVGAGAVTGQKPVVPHHVRAADSTGNVTSADQAAVVYVEATYPGSGVANVLTTTADTVAGVAVYDVSVTAPAGGTYLVKVQQSNDVVLSATLTTAPVTNPPVVTPPPVTPPPVVIPSGSTPIVTPGSDATESEDSTGTSEDDQGTSVDDQGTGASSEDGQGGFTPTSGTIIVPPSSGGNGQGASTPTSGTITVPSSSDGNSQGVSTSSQGGSSDSTSTPTSGGDN